MKPRGHGLENLRQKLSLVRADRKSSVSLFDTRAYTADIWGSCILVLFQKRVVFLNNRRNSYNIRNSEVVIDRTRQHSHA